MKTAVVICPGRGTYTKTELGVLGRRFADKGLLANFDARRVAAGLGAKREAFLSAPMPTSDLTVGSQGVRCVGTAIFLVPARYCPVSEAVLACTSANVPCAITRPP